MKIFIKSEDNIQLTDTKSIIMKDNQIKSFGNFIIKDNVIYEEISNIM
jgi:hypothetical protein